jgi:hypothetical protein
MSKNFPMELLHTIIREALDDCLARGMVLPYIICIASSNGSVVCVRSNGESTDSALLAQHYEDSPVGGSLGLLVTDQNGEVAAARITATKQTNRLMWQ